jgi:hypothetical protein
MFLKLKTIVPNDCNNWTLNTTSTPAIRIAIIGLSNKYSLIVRLILWHFLEEFVVTHLQALLQTLAIDI